MPFCGASAQENRKMSYDRRRIALGGIFVFSLSGHTFDCRLVLPNTTEPESTLQLCKLRIQNQTALSETVIPV